MDDLQSKGEAEGEGEQEEEEEDGWKTRAPGLKRGVQLSGGTHPMIPSLRACNCCWRLDC